MEVGELAEGGKGWVKVGGAGWRWEGAGWRWEGWVEV